MDRSLRSRREVVTRKGSPRDCAFLAVAVVFSCAWYIPRLGFSSDDWAFLARYVNAADQSVIGLYRASFSEQHAMRPVQLWLCAALYRVFGLEPLGYHLFNAALLVVNPVLLYCILREVKLAQTIALSTALMYAVLPSYSTDRYWYVAFAITCSMTACLASILAALRAASARGGHVVGWIAASIVAFVMSALAYEVALPIFLTLPFLVWVRMRQVNGTASRRAWAVALAGFLVVGLLAAVTDFKVRTTVRLGAQRGALAQMTDISGTLFQRGLPYGHYGLNAFSAVQVHFGEYWFKLPATVRALAGTAPTRVLWLSAAFCVFSFAYLLSVFRDKRWPSQAEWAVLIPSGLVVFGLGYAIFLTNYNVQFTATGIANRTAIAAAVGAAMVIAGSVGWLTALLPTQGSASVALAILISAASGSYFFVVNVVAEHWVIAYETQRNVLADIRLHLPAPARHTTLILDGVCPYVGPSVVFESNWDLAGALQVAYRDDTLRADVVSPRLVVGDDGLTTTSYDQPTTYRYGSDLFVYRDGLTYPLRDVEAARAYFSRFTPAKSCPPGREGVGVRLF